MFSVSVLKEYPSKAGGYFYTGVAKADGELSFFPRVNQYPDGNIKVSIPAHVSILSEKIAEQMTTAFIEAVKKHHENPATEPTEEITFGDEKILSSVESHLTPTIDGSTPTVYENTKYNVHASITFDFSDSTGEKMLGIDTTLRSRTDGSGKFIAFPSKLGSDGKYYKEVSCSRDLSTLLNQKGLELYNAELLKNPGNEVKDVETDTTQKIRKHSAPTR